MGVSTFDERMQRHRERYLQKSLDRAAEIVKRYALQPGLKTGSVPIDAAIGLQHEIITVFAQNDTDRQKLNDLLGDFASACRLIERTYPASRFPGQDLKDAKAVLAKAGASARHAEHRAMKADVFDWLDAHLPFRSIESAAAAIAKQQPIAHVTARDWYKEWKKLRSASRP